MDGPRIEVELNSEDGPPIEREPLPSTGDGRFFDTERGRLTLAAVLALVIGVAVGWIVGRAGTSNEPAAAERTTTAAPSTVGEILPEPESELEPERPVTTRFRPIAPPATAPPSTAPTAGDVSVSSVELPARLRDVPAEIVLTVSRRRLLVLDLATGQLSEREVDRQPFGPPTMYAGDGWVLLPSWDDASPSTLIRDGEDPMSVELGPVWELIGAAGSDTFWRFDENLATGRSGTLELIRLDGTRTGTTLPVPEHPALADPLGGVLVAVAGSTYRVAVDGASELTDGDLLAVSTTQAVAYECDTELRCALVRIDRRAGTWTPIALSDVSPADLTRPWWPLAGSLISPDGEAVVVSRFEHGDERTFRDVLGVLDLGSGSFTELTENFETTPVDWSPDGGFVFYVTGGRLFGWDRAAGESFEVVPGLVGVDTIAVRVSAGPTG